MPKVKTERARYKESVKKTEVMINELQAQLIDMTEYSNLVDGVVKVMNDLEQFKEGMTCK